jgi:hypothetical protein
VQRVRACRQANPPQDLAHLMLPTRLVLRKEAG